MKSLRIISYCTAVFGTLVFCWFIVAAEKRKQRAEIHSLCYTATYGTVLNTYLDIGGMPSCVALCMDTNQCASCTFDETSGICSSNSLIKFDVPTCSQNVKYAQLREHKCVKSGTFRICGLHLYSRPNEVRGYLEVFMSGGGGWGTVCDNKWEEGSNGLQNARVLCSLFGYSDGTPIYPLMSPSYYNGSIMVDNLACNGTESNIWHCSYETYPSDCSHMKDVRVRCFD